MARPGYDSNPGDAAPKTSGQRARQGENIKGMIWVLVVGIALVLLAYTVMLALSAQPVTPDNRSTETQATVAPAPIDAPEAVQSPSQ